MAWCGRGGSQMYGELRLVKQRSGMSFFVKADCEETQLVRIIGESRMRTDMVRIGWAGYGMVR